MAGLVPRIIVLALGSGALGGADALRFLLDFAGQSPLVDAAICVFVIAIATSPVLGTILVARFVRKAPASTGASAGRGAPGASATDCFAMMTLTVSLAVAVAVLVTACLVASGSLESLRLLADIAGKRPTVAVLVIVAAAVLPCTMALLRDIHKAYNADGAAHGARATVTQTVHVAGLSLVAVGIVAVHFVAPGGLDALRHSPGFTNILVAVATTTVVATAVLVRVARRA